MNKKFFIAWGVLFVAWFCGSFVVHGVLLHDDYMRLPNLFRPEADAQRYFPLMILAHVILSGARIINGKYRCASASGRNKWGNLV